jgi:hypothetical protein
MPASGQRKLLCATGGNSSASDDQRQPPLAQQQDSLSRPEAAAGAANTEEPSPDQQRQQVVPPFPFSLRAPKTVTLLGFLTLPCNPVLWCFLVYMILDATPVLSNIFSKTGLPLLGETPGMPPGEPPRMET